MSVHLVGVGPGPVDLLTVRASRLIAMSGTCLYDHDRVGPEVSALCPPTARRVDTRGLSGAGEVEEIRQALGRGDRVTRLFPGDPSHDPGLAEFTRRLEAGGIGWDLVPGVAEPGADEPHTVPREVTGARRSVALGRGETAPPGRILVLGATGHGRALADRMATAGLDVVVSSPATSHRPRGPRTGTQIDAFTGPDQLSRWLTEQRVSALIDASDPFATDLTRTALQASSETGTPLLRLYPPPWEPDAEDDWTVVSDMDGAARVVRERFSRPMLTVGVHGPAAFAGDDRGSYLIRCGEPPEEPLPRRYLLMLDRGPFDVMSERTIMARHRIDVLVARNSGGPAAAPKLEAARMLRVPVVMVQRPADPAAEASDGVPTVHSVDDAARWLVETFSSR